MGKKLKNLLLVLVLPAMLTACGSSGSDLRTQENLETQQTPAIQESSNVFECLKVENLRNVIKENQESYSGDSSPTDIFVATQFRLTNLCEKVIIGVKGTVSFQNVVEDEIFTGGLTSDQTIDMGKSITTSLSYGWTFDQFEDVHGQLSAINQDKTKANLSLSKIVFEDGTSITE